jgi:hypothetical protein
MIDVTGVDVVELVKKAYELSRPQGLGMMHFTPEPMSDEEAQAIIDSNDSGEIHLDYVGGRSCKFHVFNKDGKLEVGKSWYDHTDKQLVELLAHVGITIKEGQTDHGGACNCDSCRSSKGLEQFDPVKDGEKAIEAHRNGTVFDIKSI